jgi:hypothetical protein
MTDVFVSYKREERERVVLIADRLRALGLDVWFDARLVTGHHFDREIDQHVRKAKCALVCWSPGAIASEWVRAEAAIGRERGVLVPLLVEPCSPPVPFNTLQTEDLISWAGEGDHEGWLRVLDRIAELVERPELAQAERARGASERELRRTQALLEAQLREEEETQRRAAAASARRAELEAQLASMGPMQTSAAVAPSHAPRPHQQPRGDEGPYAGLFARSLSALTGPRVSLFLSYLVLAPLAAFAVMIGFGFALSRASYYYIGDAQLFAVDVVLAALIVIAVTEIKKRVTRKASDANPRHALIQILIIGLSVAIGVIISLAMNSGFTFSFAPTMLAAGTLRALLPFGGLGEASKVRLRARRAFNAGIVLFATALCIWPMFTYQVAEQAVEEAAAPAADPACGPDNYYDWQTYACVPYAVAEPAPAEAPAATEERRHRPSSFQ